jgi:Fe-S cluster assembly protein SufD
METLTNSLPGTDFLCDNFDTEKANLAGKKWMLPLREKAYQAFMSTGLPTRKDEEYKYSPADKIFKSHFSHFVANQAIACDAAQIQSLSIEGLEAIQIVMINGELNDALSNLSGLPKGITVCSMAKAMEEYQSLLQEKVGTLAQIDKDPFVALNTIWAEKGLFVRIEKNTTIEQPIHLMNIVSAKDTAIQYFRNFILAEENAEASIIESFDVLNAQQEQALVQTTEVFVSKNARLKHYKLQNDCDQLNLVDNTFAHQDSHSVFDTNTVTLKGKWVRNNLSIYLDGEHCESHLNGLFLTNGNQHIDNHTRVDHAKPNCESNQLYKGILNDKSTTVFNGKIYVHRDAQKTNAYQSSKNILLSDDATANTKPQLEIYADDVKCSHGSSTGELNEEQLFYLRARGLGLDTAKAVLMSAYAAEVVDTIRIEALQHHLKKLIDERLNKGLL